MNRKQFKMPVTFLLIVTLLLSCKKEQVMIGDHENKTVYVSDKENEIDEDAFKLENIAYLSLPNDVADINGGPILCYNRIHVCDGKYESVLVFDSLGNFLHRVGRPGHARDEIISRIETFDVDPTTGEVHIFNREGGKMLVYDKNGQFIRNVRFPEELPSSVCLSDNGGYIASCDYRSSLIGETQLLQLDADCNTVKRILVDASGNKMTCEGANTMPLFSDHKGHTAYLSLLADSIIVLSGDNVEEVVNVKFKEGFLPASVIDKAKSTGDTSYLRGNPVQYISKALINNHFVLIEYYGGQYASNYTFLMDKMSNKTYFKNGFLFVPRTLGTIVSIDDEYLIGVVTMETIDNTLAHLDVEMSQHGDGWTKTKAETLGFRYDSISVDIAMRDKPCPVVYKVSVK